MSDQDALIEKREHLTDQSQVTVKLETRILVATLGLLGGFIILFGRDLTGRFVGMLSPLVFTTKIATENVSLSTVLGVTSTLGVFVQIIGMPLFGYLADKYGRIKFILIGTVLLGLSTIVYGFSTNLPIFVAASIGFALGRAILVPVTFAFLLQATTSYWFFCSIAGLTFTVGAITEYASSSLIALDLFDLGYETIFSLTGGSVIALGLLGSALIAGSYALLRPHQWPKTWLEAEPLSTKSKIVLFLGLALLSQIIFTNIRMALFLPANRENMSYLQIGVLTSLITLIGLLAAFGSGFLADFVDWLSGKQLNRKLGKIALFSLGVLLLLVSVLLKTLPPTPSLTMVAVVISSLSSSILFVTIVGFLAINTKQQHLGFVFGLLFTLEALGSAVGPVILGLATDAGINTGTMILSAMFFLVLAFPIIVQEFRHQPDV